MNTGLPMHCPSSPSPVTATSRALFVGFERGAFTSGDGAHWHPADLGLSLSTPTSLATPRSGTV
jgi:hypothetical protein